jgi:DNA-binding NtrC family response regulator
MPSATSARLPVTQLLLVDDDLRLAQSMADWLAELGYGVQTASSISEAKHQLSKRTFDLAFVDLRLGSDDGMRLIRDLKKTSPQMAMLAMTGYASPETAVEAVKSGAMDLVTKPIIDDELILAIQRALHQQEIAIENERLRIQLDRRSGMENILSHDYRMLKIFDVIDSIADARASILITGENGTGKSMIARAIHNRSQRASRRLVEVACGALPDTLLESELFGHVAGAYTGANVDRIGKFELADRGTLFLDEIATATPAMQVKLLRVLQELKFEPLGGTETRTVDTRVIFATNENLTKAVAEARFRQDLYYRINVINIALPSLRERTGDIPLLVNHFLREAAETCDREIDGFTREAIEAMQAYSWPGNVRQLENVVERAVLLSRGKELTIDDLPPEVLGKRPEFGGGSILGVSDCVSLGPGFNVGAVAGKTLRDALEGPEREIILQSLRDHDWNRVATADALDINRTTLYKKMKKLGLDDPRLQFAYNN